MKAVLLFFSLIFLSFNCDAGIDDVQQTLFPEAIRLGATKALVLEKRPKLEQAPGVQPKGVAIFMESLGPRDSSGLTYIFVNNILTGIIRATFKSFIPEAEIKKTVGEVRTALSGLSKLPDNKRLTYDLSGKQHIELVEHMRDDPTGREIYLIDGFTELFVAAFDPKFLPSSAFFLPYSPQ